MNHVSREPLAKWLTYIFVLLLGPLSLGAMYISLGAMHTYCLDGLDGLIFGWLFQEDTVYATGYSNRGFRQVKVGMDPDEVRKILGEPLDIRTDPYALRSRAGEVSDECWAYSRSPTHQHYRQRLVCFRNGFVSVKQSSYWID